MPTTQENNAKAIKELQQVVEKMTKLLEEERKVSTKKK
jgi:hypothetical protein